MKNVNTLRVQGDDQLIIVKENAVFHITANDIIGAWAFLICVVIVIVYIVRQLGRGLFYISNFCVESEKAQLKITRLAEVVGLMVQEHSENIETRTNSINKNVKSDFDHLEARWQNLLFEWKVLRQNRELQDNEVKLLSERLRAYLDRNEHETIESVDVINPF